MHCTASTTTRQALPQRSRHARVDVLVVGAGPAGALLAYLLATAGWRVVLVEKARLPRIKPCGGGLNWKTLGLLPEAVDSVAERVVSRVVFTQRLRQAFARTYPQPLVTMVTRCAFDHWLVQHAARAGAAVYDQCRITRLEPQARGISVQADGVSWCCRYVALADGAKGTLRRQLGFAATAPHDLGLDLDVEAGAACPWTPDTLYIDWGTASRTYAWAFPKAQHWSIGVKGPGRRGQELAGYLRQFMQHWHLTPVSPKLPYLAHMLPTRQPGMPLVQGRAVVLGDAAGLLEPFTGEGIYYALRSAHLAATALCAASVTDTAPVSYATAVEAEIMPDLSGARALQEVFDAWPWLFHTLVRAHPRSWRALARLLRGERGFRDVGRILARYPRLVQTALRYGAGFPVCR
ncbi:MAG: geranylgeranyl reductase family protein [Candidatus Tectimicrobiota bacterium]